jgi:hypothetical protein
MNEQFYQPGYEPGQENFTGYRLDLEDHHSIAANSAPYQQLMRSSEWQEVDLFSWWHIRNQGMQGSCRGHSLAANARLCYRMAAGTIDLDEDGRENEANLQDDFSPDYAYYESQKANNIRGDRGATISGGVPVGLAGVAREIDMPYTVAYDPGRVTSELRQKAAKFKFARYTKLEDVDAVFDWVGSGQGGLDWGKVWPLPFTKGCLVKGLSRAARGGGHATAGGTLIKGLTLKKLVPSLANEVTDDEWILQCMNSHSSSAQFRGFYFCTRKAVADILAHQFTEAIGWSDMAVPVVRPIDFRKQSVFG